MAGKKKHEHHEEHIDESWLIPYADLLTLLLALFIVLFSMSSIDAVKLKEMAQAMNSTFSGGSGVLDKASPVPSDQEEQTETIEKMHKSNPTFKKEQKKLQEMQKEITKFIEKQKLQSSLTTVLTDEGLYIRIKNDLLFDSGSAVVRPENRKIAAQVANLLVMPQPRNILVSGHTDNIPISNSTFRNNWYLSGIRAFNFLDLLLHNKKLDPRIFSMKGDGEYKPVAKNDTPENRAKNRRVEILIRPYNPDDTSSTDKTIAPKMPVVTPAPKENSH